MIDTDGVELPEGAVVTVVVEDGSQEPFELTADQGDELAASLADADREAGMPADRLLETLRDAR